VNNSRKIPTSRDVQVQEVESPVDMARKEHPHIILQLSGRMPSKEIILKTEREKWQLLRKANSSK
jgi:hypothetical protein